jgi:hypothetical protein
MASGGFTASILANSQAILVKVNKEVYRIAWELFTSVVNLTPSPTNKGYQAKGVLVNQWYPSVGDGVSTNGTDASDNGASSRARINAFCASGREFLGKDGRITLSNNTPYGMEAEVHGWEPPTWSGKVKAYRMCAKSLIATAARNKAIKIRIP